MGSSCTGKTVLVTGGGGYIGSHCILEFLQSGNSVIAIDNFCNSVGDEELEIPTSLQRVQEITGKVITFYKCDLLDTVTLGKIFENHRGQIDCVFHFAALKAVGESVQNPLSYYKNNIIGAINLLEAMDSIGCQSLVFSSTWCVYGQPQFLPISENHPTGNVENPYGRTKYLIEEMLKDLSMSDKKWGIVTLRYFNPLGAHQSGLIGEDATKGFTNVLPYITQVAQGIKPHFTIFGKDYDTVDGTGVRDYIHIMDMANAHLLVLNTLLTSNEVQRGYKCYNLGSGKSVSVLQLVKVVEKIADVCIPLVFEDARPGDIPAIVADSSLIEKELGWTVKHDIETMCEDFWRWKTKNPNGYKSPQMNGAVH